MPTMMRNVIFVRVDVIKPFPPLAANRGGAWIEGFAYGSAKLQSWPGNVRKLENVMRKALLAAQGYTINLDHARNALDKNSGNAYSVTRPVGEYMDELLAAERREEITDAYARLLETVERELCTRAIEQAQVIKPKPPAGLAPRASP